MDPGPSVTRGRTSLKTLMCCELVTAVGSHPALGSCDSVDYSMIEISKAASGCESEEAWRITAFFFNTSRGMLANMAKSLRQVAWLRRADLMLLILSQNR